MQPLFQYQQQNSQVSPSNALHHYVTSVNSASLHPQFHPNGSRTPSMNGPLPQQHFMPSPATTHFGLPPNQHSTNTSSSSATLNMSPALQNHMVPPTSVGMVAQASQQGTNTSAGTGSQGTSANTSPNMTNKRRRPSGVKIEGEDGGGDGGVNGVGSKVKASPRVTKRQKGAA